MNSLSLNILLLENIFLVENVPAACEPKSFFFSKFSRYWSLCTDFGDCPALIPNPSSNLAESLEVIISVGVVIL